MTAVERDDGSATNDGDARLVDEAVSIVREARIRAPQDFLFAIALLLGTLAVALLAVGLLASGVLQDLALNLASEVIGAGLTVVIIDGLWRRMQVGTSAGLDAMAARLERRRDAPMTADERQAWEAFVGEYRSLARDRSIPGRLRSLSGYGRRMRELEAAGNQTLAEFDRAATEAAWRDA